MGSYRTTAAADYKVTDGTETVTFAALRGSTTTTLTIHYADPQDYSLKQIAQSDGHLQVGDRAWILGSDQFTGGIVPIEGDTLTDADSVAWKLVGVPVQDAIRVSWICQSRKAQ